MPLSAGSRLGHYDVTALLGEGGMVRSTQPVTPAWTARWPREHVDLDADQCQRFELAASAEVCSARLVRWHAVERPG